jgi:hypothetical protein
MKRLLTEWERIFASYISDKSWITKIYRELKKLDFPKFIDPMKKWTNELNRSFLKKEVQWLIYT